ncbi:MAG TPA: pyridoxal 5'-phosphate synthase glutaminase subunit PdxT [Candidatus Acidoferrales bacterium]|nr:pyridoxal 5'-phosphate synthase glutaminase subunit PdxT [Candidatus Acidoferrales bacterium]
MRIGILAIQGDFEAHARALERLGVETALVKVPADLEGLDGLVLPGGESTTHLKVLIEEGLFDPLARRGREGLPLFGTCAGAILLAREVKNPAQASLGLVDMTVVRNAYGRQLESCVTAGLTRISAKPLEMVFIRAPVIERVGPEVEVLATRDGRPVLVRQRHIVAATFHPELAGDRAIHEFFLAIARNGG